MAETTRHTPHQHHLLDALPKSDYERIASRLRIGRPVTPCLFPHHVHRFITVRHGGWRFG